MILKYYMLGMLQLFGIPIRDSQIVLKFNLAHEAIPKRSYRTMPNLSE